MLKTLESTESTTRPKKGGVSLSIYDGINGNDNGCHDNEY